MKIHTRALIILLVFTMLLPMVACGKSVKLKILDTAYAEEEYAICLAKDNTQLLSDINSALEKLKSNGTAAAIIDKYISGKSHSLTFQQNIDGMPTLTMATNAEFPPYEYFENGVIVGIDAEMAAAIADELGMKLVIDNMDFGAIIAAVQTGKVDMGMAGMTVNETRLESVNFTTSYAKGVQVVIIREDSTITAVDDLFADDAEYMISVQQDTTGDIYATDDFGDDRIDRYNKGADAVQALIAGKVDCVIIDNEPAKAFVATNNK